MSLCGFTLFFVLCITVYCSKTAVMLFTWQLFSSRNSTHNEPSANGQSTALRDAYSTLQRDRDKTRPLTIHITQPSSSTPSGSLSCRVTGFTVNSSQVK